MKFRPTPHQPRKSHYHCVLPCSLGRKNSRVRSNVWTFSPSDALKAVSDQSFSFQSITDSPTQRQSTISFSFNDLRTLFIATEDIPPVPPFWFIPSAAEGSTSPNPRCVIPFPFRHLRECILQPLSFHIHPGMGGTPRGIQTLGRLDVRTFRRIRSSHCGAHSLVQQFAKAPDFFTIRGNNSAPPGV